MITVISPAKRLDLKTPTNSNTFSIPEDLDRSEQLINKLRKTSAKKLKELMGISAELVALNKQRYDAWDVEFNSENARQAVFMFDGEVYRGLNSQSFTESDLSFAQSHLSILSGLHGLLRPMDLTKPYRLEMGTKLPVGRKKNLYQFWGDSIAIRLNDSFGNKEENELVNLASAEYFKAIDLKKINARVIEPVFMDLKNGKLKVLTVYAKQARGMMASFIIKNKLNHSEDLKMFEGAGYRYTEELSDQKRWIFTR